MFTKAESQCRYPRCPESARRNRAARQTSVYVSVHTRRPLVNECVALRKRSRRAELRGVCSEGKSMSTVRLAVSAIVDAHRRVGLESPVSQRDSAGPGETDRRKPEAGEVSRCRRAV